ncbi:MAG TPA: VOC family protein [Usitatibacter sp.]|nr:VOC family protein [Usitatibacter sp.]
MAHGQALSRGLDHLVVAARTLEEGARWIHAKIGADCVPGGKHETMGTHNLLLSLGADCYLEVVAIDPRAPNPGRPRWFEMDTPAMQSRLAHEPALVHWAERSDDLEAELSSYPEDVRIEPFTRGAFRWRLALTADGSLPGQGTLPTLIQWQSAHPCTVLPDSGVRLASFRHEGATLSAAFSTPAGMRTIP